MVVTPESYAIAYAFVNRSGFRTSGRSTTWTARSSPRRAARGLTRQTTESRGPRPNGRSNQADVPQVITFRLFDGGGHPIGQAERLLAPREFFQLNDVFGFLGVTAAVESGYCLVEGSELLPLFAYAAVIDNCSQDPIFIPGEGDPEHPPIVPLAP